MVHVALGGFRPQRVDLLSHLDHVEGGHAHDLGFATLEQCAAVRPRDDRDLGGQRADVGDAATIDPEVVGQNTLAHKLFGQRAERGADFLLTAFVGVGEPRENLGLELVGALVALRLAADGQRLRQLVGGYRGHRVEDVVLVFREQRVLGGLLAGSVVQLLLRGAQRGDERLGGFQTLGHDALGGRARAARDELDHVVGGFGLDHHDRDVIGRLAARDDHVEHGVLELLDGRERDPLAVDERDAHTADGPENGRPEIWVDADAALIASTS